MVRRAIADAVVGADGVHSVVRDILFGTAPVNFTGRIAYRTTYPAALLGGAEIDDCTKWWGEDRHIVIYYVKPDRSEVYFVTSQPEPDFRIESWSAKGDVSDLRAAFEGFHPQVDQVLAACPDVHKWAIVDRDALEHWADGKVTLLGDACHPMTPYMAQGAAMAIEDAAVLSRCLDGVDRDGVANAFRRFEATRKERTTRVQETSRANIWLKREDRYRLGLRLRRLDGAAGGLNCLLALAPTFLVRIAASSAASRSASAMSSTVLALKNGSSGSVGHVTVASRIARGPAVDLAEVFDDQRVTQLVAQGDAPQADHRMRLVRRMRRPRAARSRATAPHAAARRDRAAGTGSRRRRSAPIRPRAGSPRSSRARPKCRRAGRGSRPRHRQ